MLKTEYVRDGRNKIIGSRTSGFENGDVIARDRKGQILGHANARFQNTRDGQGRLISQNVADVDLLFGW